MCEKYYKINHKIAKLLLNVNPKTMFLDVQQIQRVPKKFFKGTVTQNSFNNFYDKKYLALKTSNFSYISVYTRKIIKVVRFYLNYAVCWTLRTSSICFCWTIRTRPGDLVMPEPIG